MRGALSDVPGVVSAKVSCTTGRAECQVEPGTDPEALAAAVNEIGFATRVIGTSGPKSRQ